jgi:hypothetical protein
MTVCPESGVWNITLSYFIGNTALEAVRMFTKSHLVGKGAAKPTFVIAEVSWWNLACFQSKPDGIKLPRLMFPSSNGTGCNILITPYSEPGTRPATIENYLDSSYRILQKGTQEHFPLAKVVRVLSPVLAAPTGGNKYHNLNRVLLDWAANKSAHGRDPQFLDQTTWLTDRVSGASVDVVRDRCLGNDNVHGIHVMTVPGQLIRSMYALQALYK